MLSRTTSLAAAADGTLAPARRRRELLDIYVLIEGAAREWAARPENKQAWNALYEACPWATAFQSPVFFDVWCRHYGQLCPPVLVTAHREDGSLAGIMPLALKGDVVTGAGTHQAEYHGWLSTEDDATTFVAGALDAVARDLPGKALRLRYLPPATPEAAIAYLRGRNDRVIMTRHHVHEFALDRAAIERSLKKKGNKSKLNRLKRRGELDIRRLDADGLAVNLRRIMNMYDLRQGAVNGVCPFLDDPRKAAFHLDWIKSAPQQLDATALMVDGELASGLLLVKSKTDVHLAISAHAPEHAENSPMKFHLYQAALALADEGRRTLDLTPGGDPWKERFSTNVRDVWELVMYRTLADAARDRAVEAGKNLVRRALSATGLSVTQARSLWRNARQGLAAFPEGLVRPQPHATDVTIDLARLSRAETTLQVTCNDLDLLLRQAPELVGEPRQRCLMKVLERIESGEHCYAVTRQGQLICLAWFSKANAHVHDLTIATQESAEALLATLVSRIAADAGHPGSVVVTVAGRASGLRAALARLAPANADPSRAAATVQ